MSKKNLMEIGLLFVALFWGATYPISKLLLENGLHANEIIFYRFAFALPLFLFLPNLNLKTVSKRELGVGFLFGAVLFLTLFLEIVGIGHTSATNAGFLVALTIVFVLLFEVVLNKRRVSLDLVIVIGASLIGSLLLTSTNIGEIDLNLGDYIVISASAIRGFQFYIFAKLAKKGDSNLVNISIVQFIVVILLLTIASPLMGQPRLGPLMEISALTYLLVLAFFSTFFAFFYQLIVSREIGAMKISFILSTEPAFAAFLAVWMLGEKLTISQYLGGAIIVAASMVGKIIENRLRTGIQIGA